MDITLQNNNKLFLETINFREYVPKNVMIKILNSGKIIYSNYNSFPDDLWYSNLKYKNEKIKDPENHLNIYFNNYDNLLVKYKKYHENWGRVYPDLSVSILKSYIRRTLLKNDYYDFDLSGTYLNILKSICEKNGINCPILKKVINQRDDIIKYFIKECKFPNDRDGITYAKDLIFIHLYNGDEDDTAEIKKKYKINVEFPPILRDFKDEMDKIKKELIKRNPVLYDYCKKTFDNVKNKTFMNNKNTLGRGNLNGYFLSLYLQEQEVRIVDKILKWFYYNTNVMKRNGVNGYCIYEYDGFMLLRENIDKEFGGSENFVELLNRKMRDFWLDLKWESKNLDENIMNLNENIHMNYKNLFILCFSIILIYLIYIYKNESKFLL